MKPYFAESGIEIYHGDCREILWMFKADLLLTDPPYGVQMSQGFDGAQSFNGNGKTKILRREYPDLWDVDRPTASALKLACDACRVAIIWGGNFFADLLPRTSHWIVWDKLNTMPSFGDCELAWTNIDRKSVKKLTLEWNGLLGKEDSRDHPTQKPLALMQRCIQHVPETKSVLDPYCGSGTSLLAAKSLSLSAIGIEIEEKYCEIAAKRLSQSVFDFTATSARRR